MATTSNTYTGNGTNKLFSITFPYLDTTDIDVYLNGTLQTVTTQYFFANATTIQFVTAPSNGATILLNRSTDDTNLQATFFPGSSIKASDLNFNFDQVLFLSQETANNAANQSTAGLQAQITATTNTANTAITTANAATVTANSANTTATGIAGTANTALTNANAAVVTANTATSTANAATVTANSALTTVSGLSGVNLNRIINGAMAIDQRNVGASQTFTSAAALAYSVDRWYGYCTGANVTGQQIAGATAGQFRYRFTGAASVTGIGFGQRIEQLNSTDLAGTTATLSVDLANSVLTSVTWTAYYATTADTFGTLASPTRTQIATGTFTVNSTVTRYSTQISVPGAATTGVEILFTVQAQTSGTWTIGDVQLESGTVATPFERRSYGQELALCQRYFQSYASTTFRAEGYFTASGSTFSLTSAFCTSIRTAPTISSSYSTSLNITNGPFMAATATGFNATANTSNGGQTTMILGLTTFSAEL